MRWAWCGACVAAVALGAIGAASGAKPLVQTNWTIVSASGETMLKANGSVGDGAARRTYRAKVIVRWSQRRGGAPGTRTVSFAFGSMPRYTPGIGDTGQRNPIVDVNATAVGTASMTDANGTRSCTIPTRVPSGFFADSAAPELFLSASRTGRGKLVVIVDGQSPNTVASDPPCSVALPFPDTLRESVRARPLALVSKRARGARVTLRLHRVMPLVEQGVTLGTIEETATIALRLESAL